MSDQLKPWQTITQTCDRCGRLATTRIAAGAQEIEIDQADPTIGRLIWAGGEPERRGCGCDGCADLMAGQWCDEYGGSVHMPLRLSWHRWLLQTWPGRPLERLLVMIHNWRFDR